MSVAVGFAFKDVLENLLAGVLLLLRDLFQSGDQTSVAGFEGVVEGVTVRETLLRTFDGERVLIPNATVYTNPIEVHTHHPAARSVFTVELAPDSDLSRAREVARAALRPVPGVLPDPAPQVLAVQWTAHAVRLECRVWSRPDRQARTLVVDSASEAVQRAYADAGLRLPADRLLVDLRPPDDPPQ